MKDIESATVSSTPHGTVDMTGLNLTMEPLCNQAWVPMVGFASLVESQYPTRFENTTGLLSPVVLCGAYRSSEYGWNGHDTIAAP
jgi:hypothetical protein